MGTQRWDLSTTITCYWRRSRVKSSSYEKSREKSSFCPWKNKTRRGERSEFRGEFCFFTGKNETFRDVSSKNEILRGWASNNSCYYLVACFFRIEDAGSSLRLSRATRRTSSFGLEPRICSGQGKFSASDFYYLFMAQFGHVVTGVGTIICWQYLQPSPVMRWSGRTVRWQWSHLQQGGRCHITWIECITLKWYTFLSVAWFLCFFVRTMSVGGWSACCAAGNERHACTNCAVRCSSVLFPTLKQSLSFIIAFLFHPVAAL